MSITTEAFRKAMGMFATGVTVVTTGSKDPGFYGVTVSAFTSVSLDPHLILVCLDNRLSGLESFMRSGFFVVNILSEDQEVVSNYFATPGTDRSEGSGFFERSDSGLPLLTDSLAWMHCRVHGTHSAGDHTILIGEVLEARMDADCDESGPLLYFRGRYHGLLRGRIGHSAVPDRKTGLTGNSSQG